MGEENQESLRRAKQRTVGVLVAALLALVAFSIVWYAVHPHASTLELEELNGQQLVMVEDERA